jgi:hypothetical protein
MSNTTMINTTAARPSGFAMPTSAPLTAAISGARTEATGGMAIDAVCTAPTDVVRPRFVAGDAFVKGAFPGTTAWSPPTC